MVPLLEPPLLLDCRCDEEEDTEDSAVCPLGEGEGVRVGEVLLEVVEVPEGGLLLVSNFLPPGAPPLAGETGSSDGLGPGAGPTGLDRWPGFCSDNPAAFFLWAAIWDKTLSTLPPERLCSSPPGLLMPPAPLEPPEECGEWLKFPELVGDVGLLERLGNLTGLTGVESVLPLPPGWALLAL